MRCRHTWTHLCHTWTHRSSSSSSSVSHVDPSFFIIVIIRLRQRIVVVVVVGTWQQFHVVASRSYWRRVVGIIGRSSFAADRVWVLSELLCFVRRQKIQLHLRTVITCYSCYSDITTTTTTTTTIIIIIIITDYSDAISKILITYNFTVITINNSGQ